MTPPKSTKISTILVCLFGCFSLFVCSAVAQTENITELKLRANQLIKQTKYVEALPLLEKIVAAEPDNARMHYNLATALLSRGAIVSDSESRKALRIRARNEFIKSRDLGVEEANVGGMIESIPTDGSEVPFSSRKEVDAAMQKGEAFFAQSKMDEALREYQRALTLDPKLYEAALFCGDIFLQKGDFGQAEIWYQKAIAINPNRETAYRYSATPLMKQGKHNEALERYIEAFISEPYNRFAVAGLLNWGKVTRTTLAHPKIEIPTSVTFDEKGDVKINLDASLLLGGTDDGGFAWISYGVTRKSWHKERFAKIFPNERSYRHSVEEEAEALLSVLSLATSDKKTKKLSPSLALLKKLNDEGLLKAYILFVLVDEGISKDHPKYLMENRDKLRRYITQYVLTGGGN